jgi:hypothetical protein
VTESDVEYYARRSLEEVAAASAATHPNAANAHARLADEYATLVEIKACERRKPGIGFIKA